MELINTALLSYGLSGKVFHAPFIRVHPGFRLVGAWERSKKLICQDDREAKSYSTLQSLLNDETIALVVVNTPTNTHYEYARKCLEAGKHVIVEKAFTTSVKEAVELGALAAAGGLVLSVFHNRRWDSDFATVRKVVASGVLGNIHTATFNFCRFKPELHTKSHKETPGPGAGLLNDLGPHLIDQALSIWGMPSAIQADVRTLRLNSLVDDDFAITLYYGNLRVRLRSSLMAGGPQPGYLLEGSKGAFVKNRTDRQEDLLKAGTLPDAFDWYTEPPMDRGCLYLQENGVLKVTQMQSEQGSYLRYYEGIYNAVTHGSPVPVSAQDGIDTMRIIEAASESSQMGKVIISL